MLAACATTLLIPTFASAQEARDQGYLTEKGGSVVVSGTGLCWHTGRWTTSSESEQCDPSAPVAVTPEFMPPTAAGPVAVAPEVIQPPQKVSFSADALFAFDKSELKPEGKVMLDDLAQQVKGATYESIVATGHADRIGSAAYNQDLSQRRANTVRDYLISKDVRANSISAEGKGESQPVTLAGDCKGPKNAALISCLQPDRRVDVEMQGTRAATVLR
ncbi:MAG: OmpA family protein [Burkholderiaceae bacterium]|nr:MAG: OmpA family protein [Burkholderiaceae bacterium]